MNGASDCNEKLDSEYQIVHKSFKVSYVKSTVIAVSSTIVTDLIRLTHPTKKTTNKQKQKQKHKTKKNNENKTKGKLAN